MCIYTDALVDCFIAPLRVDVVYCVWFYILSHQSTKYVFVCESAVLDYINIYTSI